MFTPPIILSALLRHVSQPNPSKGEREGEGKRREGGIRGRSSRPIWPYPPCHVPRALTTHLNVGAPGPVPLTLSHVRTSTRCSHLFHRPHLVTTAGVSTALAFAMFLSAVVENLTVNLYFHLLYRMSLHCKVRYRAGRGRAAERLFLLRHLL